VFDIVRQIDGGHAAAAEFALDGVAASERHRKTLMQIGVGEFALELTRASANYCVVHDFFRSMATSRACRVGQRSCVVLDAPSPDVDFESAPRCTFATVNACSLPEPKTMTTPNQPPPVARLAQMATGHFLARIVYVAAKLGIADQLAGAPKSAAEISSALGCDTKSLHRFMRTLTNFDILAPLSDGKFALTPLGDALRTDAPGFARSSILTMGGPIFWNAFSELQYTIETGKPATEKVLGMGAWDYLGQHPNDARRFSETMLNAHGAEPAAVAEAYDVSSVGVVVDVGGASGKMLASILSKYAGVRGVLFDLPQATTEAPALLKDRGIAERVTTEHGSFFDGVPVGGDVYILSHIIHDWSDEQSLAILKRCRASMKSESRLLLIELVLNEEGVSGFGSADVVMMTLLGGAERTTNEYAELFSRAGLRLSRVVKTTTSASIIEAVCA